MSIMGRRVVAAGQPSRIPTFYLALISMTSAMIGMSAIVFKNNVILDISILITVLTGIIVYIKWDDPTEMSFIEPTNFWLHWARNIMVAGLFFTVIAIGINLFLGYLSPLMWVCLWISWFGFINFVLIAVYIHEENHPEASNG